MAQKYNFANQRGIEYLNQSTGRDGGEMKMDHWLDQVNCCLTGNFNLGHGSCQLDLDLLDAGFGLLDTLVERNNLRFLGLEFLLELFGVICRMMPGNTNMVG